MSDEPLVEGPEITATDAELRNVEHENRARQEFGRIVLGPVLERALAMALAYDSQAKMAALERETMEGVPLRDWFAGQALIGQITRGGPNKDDTVAEQAYRYADAMMRARGKDGT